MGARDLIEPWCMDLAEKLKKFCKDNFNDEHAKLHDAVDDL